MEQPLVILTNAPNLAIAEAIARALIEQELAACANLVPGVKSIYRWQGIVEETQEVTLSIKTRRENYPLVEALIKKIHPFEVPEIIALPILFGLPSYLKWIHDETKRDCDV